MRPHGARMSDSILCDLVFCTFLNEQLNIVCAQNSFYVDVDTVIWLQSSVADNILSNL